MTKVDLAKQSITMEMLVSMDGLTVNSAGFIKCPFHEDKTNSLKVYAGSKGFYCFGCNTGGSVIDYWGMRTDRTSKKDTLAVAIDLLSIFNIVAPDDGFSPYKPSAKDVNKDADEELNEIFSSLMELRDELQYRLLAGEPATPSKLDENSLSDAMDNIDANILDTYNTLAYIEYVSDCCCGIYGRGELKDWAFLEAERLCDYG